MTSEPASLSFSAWENFYVIVGSSAGALTGLQFVVLTLVAQARSVSGNAQSLSAFGSPNVVHFCSALLVSALYSVPWRRIAPLGVITVVCGLLGVVYAFVVLRRALRQQGYRPVFEDWLWHTVLPLAAYAALLDSGVMLLRGSLDAQYLAGGAALLLVFVGIHNAWDTVMYITAREQEHKAATSAEGVDTQTASPQPATPARAASTTNTP